MNINNINVTIDKHPPIWLSNLYPVVMYISINNTIYTYGLDNKELSKEDIHIKTINPSNKYFPIGELYIKNKLFTVELNKQTLRLYSLKEVKAYKEFIYKDNQ